MGKNKKVKKSGGKKRLVEMEIDEISMVDKPAIGEEFIVTKSLKGKGGNTVGKKVKKSVELKKGIDWASTVRKAVDHSNTHCKLCSITRQQEIETVGMGLLCSTCFNCAITHMDKGVFDQCLAGNFDADAFLEKNPDLKPTAKAEGEAEAEKPVADEESGEKEGDADGEEGEAEEGEASEESGSEETDGEVEKVEDEAASEDEGDAEESEESEEGEEAGEAEEDAAGDAEEGEEAGESEEADVSKRVSKVEKNLAQIEEMLSASLDMHEQVAMMLSEIADLTVGALELAMVMQDGSSDNVQQAVKTIRSKIEVFRKDNVRKAGAKISQSRLNVLREIADKLASLLDSVSAEAKSKKGKTSKSAVVESLEAEVAKLKKSVAEAGEAKGQYSELKAELEKMANRLNDIEASAGASTEIDEDESEEDDDSESDDGSGSVFKGFGPLQAVTERISKSRRISTVKKES